jgi:peptidyl-prolyl cis-trans isomerase C
MKIRISRQILQIAAAETCFVLIFATVLSAKAKAKSEPNTPAPVAETVAAESNKPAEMAAKEPNKLSETAADSVAVTVNGVDIKESQVDAELAPQLKKMAAQLPPTFVEQYKKQLRQQVLEGMIVEQLLDEKVKENNIVITDANVDEHLEKAAAQQNLTLKDIKEMMESRGQNFDEAKQRLKKGLAYQKLMEAQWTGKINVTDDEAKKYYSENKAKFEMPEQIRASHILIMPDPNAADPNQAKIKAKEKAENLLKQIKGGADFAELAKANSGDTYSAVQGGDLGFFGKSQMVPAFETAAFALKPGQVSDVVETQFGYHIIKLTDRKDANTMPFEQAKDNIVQMLTQNKQADFAEGYVKSLKAKAKIVYPPGKEPQEASKPTVDANKPGPSDTNKPADESEKKTSAKTKTSDKKKNSAQ